MIAACRWLWTKRIVGAFVALTIAFTAQGLLLERTIGEVQHDRVISCRHTYEGVREIFKPFFLPAKARTAKERHDIRKFNRRVDRLKANCDVQVSGGRKPA